MNGALSFISYPLGQFLNFIYSNLAFGSYGLAIIIFTLFVRAILFPLTLKQLHSSTRMQELQPQMQEIQKRYKDDKEKLNQELMKMYKENNVNPMGGCLPLLIQMPILFSLIYVIAEPLTYMLQWTPEMIAAKASEYAAAIPDVSQRVTGFYEQIGLVNHFDILNMKFLGLNLGLVPQWHPGMLFNNPMSGQYLALLIIPVLATVTTWISIKLSMGSAKKNPDNQMQNQMQTTMMITMPIMTLVFSFQFPAGLGLYWAVGNVFQIFVQLYVNKFMLAKKEAVNN